MPSGAMVGIWARAQALISALLKKMTEPGRALADRMRSSLRSMLCASGSRLAAANSDATATTARADVETEYLIRLGRRWRIRSIRVEGRHLAAGRCRAASVGSGACRRGECPGSKTERRFLRFCRVQARRRGY